MNIKEWVIDIVEQNIDNIYDECVEYLPNGEVWKPSYDVYMEISGDDLVYKLEKKGMPHWIEVPKEWANRKEKLRRVMVALIYKEFDLPSPKPYLWSDVEDLTHENK